MLVTSRLARIVLPWFWIALVASLAQAGEGVVRILERPRLPAFGSLQQAIDVALDGETLLVGRGVYRPIHIDGRKLTLVAAPGTLPIVNGTSRIENVGPQRSVVLAGIEFRGASFPGVFLAPGTPAVALENNAGGVWFVDCTLTGGAGSVGMSPTQLSAGGSALTIRSSGRVALSRCTLFGGNGADHPSSNAIDGFGGRGGAGLDAQDSTFALYSTTLLGGKGGRAGTRGGDGGDGVSASASGVYLGACTSTGGNGGATLDFLVLDGADGGHGVEGDLASQVRVLDSILTGGLAGTCPVCSQPGSDGRPTFVQGFLANYSGLARQFTAERITGDRELWSLSVSGVPGDLAYLIDNDRPTLTATQPVLGVTLVPTPPTGPLLLGTIPPGGVLNTTVPIQGLGFGVHARQRFVQGLVVDGTGQSWPSTPILRLELSRSGGSDCDSNRRNDALEVARAQAPDLDGDLAPDSCALDCNNNGQSDVADVRSGLEPDLDDDFVPDACEVPTTVYVDPAAPAGGSGEAATPFRALRPAVAATLPGGVVLLRSGIYSGSANREVSTRGKSFTLRSSTGAANCTFDLGTAGRALRVSGGNLVVEGLTFRNGNAVVSPFEPQVFASGGAIQADGGQLVLSQCVFEDNSSLAGGAVAMIGGRIEHCEFRRNHALSGGDGGAVRCATAAGLPSVSLSVVASGFSANDATQRGGALSLAHAATVLDGCRFLGNSAPNGGAVSSDSGSSPTCDVHVLDSLFAGNVATTGGALHVVTLTLPVSNLRLENSTFVGNAAATLGGCQYVTGRGVVEVQNCIQRLNTSGNGASNRFAPVFGTLTVGVSRNCVAGGATAFQGGLQTYGADNFDLDPLFLLPAGADGNPATFDDNDYRLAVLSPCVDAGDASLLPTDLADRDGDGDTLEPLPFDLDGAPRRVDDPLTPDTAPGAAPALDLGAFERQP